jgi:cell division protein FtsB
LYTYCDCLCLVQLSAARLYLGRSNLAKRQCDKIRVEANVTFLCSSLQPIFSLGRVENMLSACIKYSNVNNGVPLQLAAAIISLGRSILAKRLYNFVIVALRLCDSIMFDFYQKRKLRGFVNSPLTKGVLLVLVLLMAVSAFQRFQIAREMHDRRQEAETDVEELRQQKSELEGKVKYLSDERGIEAEMRRQFDVALPDEQVVVIVDSNENTASKPTTTPSDGDSNPAWYQFWR